jgi:drug/metabolite transporter (DMT)-like permease
VYAVIGWGALPGSVVAGMGVLMVVNDSPAGNPVAMAAFLVLAGALLVLNGWTLRPLFANARQGADPAGAVG